MSELIDECFYIKQKKWGTWDSYDKDGKCIVTSLTEDACLNATRFILQFRQENKLQTKVSEEKENTYSGTIEYKL